MKSALIAAFSLSMCLPLFIAPASAAPKRVNGSYCHFPNVAKGTWVGYFDGAEETISVFSGKDTVRPITVWRCFKTKADCTAWKYWMQTDYRAGPQLAWCRKK